MNTIRGRLPQITVIAAIVNTPIGVEVHGKPAMSGKPMRARIQFTRP